MNTKNTNHLHFKCSLSAAFLAVMSITDAAASDDVSATSDTSSAPMVRLGNVDVYPGFSITGVSDNNIFNSDLNKRYSNILVLTPSVVMQTQKDADSYTLTYKATKGVYEQSTADNYVDHDLQGDVVWNFSQRTSLNLSPEYIVGHDQRGSTFGLATVAPNTWNSAGLGGKFIYGSEGSRGKIELNADYRDVRYQTNLDLTNLLVTNLAYNKATRDIGGIFYYRAAPKISTFVQLNDKLIAYKDPSITLRGHEKRLMLGATWAATAQTGGTFKMGGLRKEFDNSVHPTSNNLAWEGNIRWSPRSYAYVDWISGRATSETTLTGASFELTTYNTLIADFKLNERIELQANAGQSKLDFNGTARTDQSNFYGLKAEYKLREWLIGGAEFISSTRTSTGYNLGILVGNASPNYSRNVFALSVRSKL